MYAIPSATAPRFISIRVTPKETFESSYFPVSWSAYNISPMKNVSATTAFATNANELSPAVA